MKRTFFLFLLLLMLGKLLLAQTNPNPPRWDWKQILLDGQPTALCRGEANTIYIAAEKNGNTTLYWTKSDDSLAIPFADFPWHVFALCYGIDSAIYIAGSQPMVGRFDLQTRTMRYLPLVGAWIPKPTVMTLGSDSLIYLYNRHDRESYTYHVGDTGFIINYDIDQTVQTMAADTVGGIYFAGIAVPNKPKKEQYVFRTHNKGKWCDTLQATGIYNGYPIKKIVFSIKQNCLFLVSEKSTDVYYLSAGKRGKRGGPVTDSIENLWGDCVMDMAVDDSGTLWACGYLPVVKLAIASETWEKVGTRLPIPYTFAVIPMPSGIVYTAGPGQLYKYCFGNFPPKDTVVTPAPPNPVPVPPREGVYPNPTSGIVTAYMPNSSYVLSDTWGRILKKGQINTDPVVLDLRKLANGVYFLHSGANITKIVLVQ